MLSTRQFAARHAEFVARDVALVRVFHSPAAALRDHAIGPHALPFPVLADPEKRVYRDYGIASSWLALLKPGALARIREARAHGLAPRWRDALRDGIGGTPADFLIGGDGKIVALHYGAHFADSASPATALAWIDAAAAR